MADAPLLTLTGVNIGTPDPPALADFYARLLGREVSRADDTDAYLTHPDGAVPVSFQREDVYTRPVWPSRDGEQQMMMHLEIEVDDLPGAVEHALACGATLAEFQPQDDVRVCLDPDGHPFCLYL